MRTVELTAGERMPALGQGTWYLGDDRSSRAEEIATLQLGLDLGLKLIDTAEMYGEGRSEELVGEALRGRRDEAFIVTKVYPHNASREGAVAACERSLKRLGTDRVDLYLLHWRGGVPFSETLEAFDALRRAGKIRYYGVSNLDLDDMKAWWATPGGRGTVVNQVLYNLGRRGIEYDLLPWLRAQKVVVMAYSPIEQARLLRNARLREFAKRYGMTPAQVALSWLLEGDGVIAIPKCARRAHLKENFCALEHSLSAGQRAELDALFPPPTGPQPLEML